MFKLYKGDCTSTDPSRLIAYRPNSQSNPPLTKFLQANATCTPSTPAPARKRRRPNQDLQERLARCEELLKQYAGGSVPSQADLQAAAPSVASVTTPASTFKAETSDYSPTFDDFPDRRHPGKVIHQDGGVRFIDSQLWSTFYDEVGFLRMMSPLLVPSLT